MLIPVEMLPAFISFIESAFGVDVTTHSIETVERSGEYARFFVLGNFFVVRKQEFQDKPRLIEIHTADPDILNSVETAFMLKIQREIEKEGE